MPKKRSPSILKRIRKERRRRIRRLPLKSSTKTIMKKLKDLARTGKKEEARTLLPLAYKAVDIAAKKHLIHWKNAAKKKSQLARLVAQ